MKKGREKINKKSSQKLFYKTNPNGGISLIVLVITIIVVIILAAAVIVSLQNNNPIVEANKARYKSDRDNMQAIFTNTVAKIMAEKQEIIGVKACELNEVKSGVSSAVGKTKYIIDNVERGRIIFDSENNTDTDYYTGKKLPIYSKETTWNVDNEGILVLQVGNERYGEEGKSEGSSGGSTNPPVTPGGDGNVTISQEEYNNLKNMFQEVKEEQKNMKSELEQMQMILSKSSECRAGKIEIGKVSPGVRELKVTFSEPMKDSNYNVIISLSNAENYWTYCVCTSGYKTNDGFYMYIGNSSNIETGDLQASYIAIPDN